MPWSEQVAGSKRKDRTFSEDDLPQTLVRAGQRSLSSKRYDKVFVIQVYWDFQDAPGKDGAEKTSLYDASRRLCEVWASDYSYDITEVKLIARPEKGSTACLRDLYARVQLVEACQEVVDKAEIAENPLIIFYYRGHGAQPDPESVAAGRENRDKLLLQSGRYPDKRFGADEEENEAPEMIATERARLHNEQWLLAAAGPTSAAKDNVRGFTEIIHKHFVDALVTKEWLTLAELYKLVQVDFAQQRLEILPIWTYANPNSVVGTPIFHKLGDDTPMKTSKRLEENVKIATKRQKLQTVLIEVETLVDSDQKWSQAQVNSLERAVFALNSGDGGKFEVKDVRLAKVQRQRPGGSVYLTLLIDSAIFFELEYDPRFVATGYTILLPSGHVMGQPTSLGETIVSVGRTAVRKISNGVRKISTPIITTAQENIPRVSQRRVSAAPSSSTAEGLQIPKARAGPSAAKKENKAP